jgi:hypothetical protein
MVFAVGLFMEVYFSNSIIIGLEEGSAGLTATKILVHHLLCGYTHDFCAWGL